MAAARRADPEAFVPEGRLSSLGAERFAKRRAQRTLIFSGFLMTVGGAVAQRVDLGSSMGTAIAGTILVAGLTSRAYGAAIVKLAVIALIGFGIARFLPRTGAQPAPGHGVRPEPQVR